jgi:hypothetical protein
MFYYFNIGALCSALKNRPFSFKVYELNIYVSPCQFSHNFAPFWPEWMSNRCYSGAVATVGRGSF